MVDEAVPPPVKGDTARAVEFLKHWMPNRPVLTASATNMKTGEKGLFETLSFPPPVDWDAVAKWIEQRQGKANLYFSVNPTIGDVDKKTSRADIASLIALHVDVDVRPGESQANGIERIIKTFDAYKLPPSDIIASGGGAQAFWRLSAPVPIDGDLTICEDLKLYNVQVERDLAGDNCHNVDRIMRLPGTINIPNEVKIKKGRVPSVATWYSTSGRTYDLGQFVKAPSIEPPKVEGFADTGKYERVRSDDERLAKVDAKWIEVGLKGDLRKKYVGSDGKTDRSRMALAFVTAMKRAHVPEQLIASILMDPSWVIGDCVRDKGGTVARHLKRLMERGGQFVEDDFSKPAVVDEHDFNDCVEKFHVRRQPHVHHNNGEFFVLKGAY